MDNSIFDKFDKIVDLDALKKDVEAAENNTFEEMPFGTYIVKVDNMELSLGKGDNAHKLYLKVRFKTESGKCIFMTQSVMSGFPLKKSMDFLKSLESSQDVVFTKYIDFSELVISVFAEIEDKKYNLEYSQNAKGFKEFNILGLAA